MLPTEILWRAPDFRKSWRRNAWQSLTLFISFILGIVAFTHRDIPFFILVVVVEFFFLLMTRGNKKKMIVNYALNEEGFFVEGETIYFKDEVAKFAMMEHAAQDINPWFEFILISRQSAGARRRILIPHEKGFLIREFLAQKWGIQEFDYHISAVEFFRRFFGM